MNNLNFSSFQSESERLNIILIDGRILSCPLKSVQPQTISPDNFEPDSSGQYLITELSVPPLQASENTDQVFLRQYHHRLFSENARVLLENAESILSDSRMFFAPVQIDNHLAYTGINGFQNPTLGVYIEWWLHFRQKSIDAKGNLIWYIAGSPVSGNHCCCSVDKENRKCDTISLSPFSEIWRSFMKVNQRYTEAKQRCQAYSLEEVLVLLGHGDNLTNKTGLTDDHSDSIHQFLRLSWN